MDSPSNPAPRSKTLMVFLASILLLAIGCGFIVLGVIFTPDTGQGWAMLSAPFILVGQPLFLVTGLILLYRKYRR